jgi:predicted Rossmann fold flavoprotein
MYSFDVVVIGAGAAGLMCAAQAGKRGRSVWLIDHAKKPAEKIRISGGGRCNFTNIHCGPHAFLSENPHFCKSALSQYTPRDFIELVERYNIAYHEKKLGQLFCDNSAKDIISMLFTECEDAGVRIDLETNIQKVEKIDAGYNVRTSKGMGACKSLVIATGGLSIPKIGASSFGYKIAEQFGHTIIPTRAGLVPLTFQADILEMCKSLSGVSVEAEITADKTGFAEGMLFTHRGLSGPSILQISSYWHEGNAITVNMKPATNIFDYLKERRDANPKQDIQTALSELLPKRLVTLLCENEGVSGRLCDIPNSKLRNFVASINQWTVKPNGTEGYRTAEVTLGGVNTNELSSKTMESKFSEGLYFIGEVVDVTGWLGGYNFQWAWSSGYVAAQYV